MVASISSPIDSAALKSPMMSPVVLAPRKRSRKGQVGCKDVEKSKDTFIGIASHELKTPLTSLKLYNEIILRKIESKSNVEAAKYMHRMDTQLNKLIRIVDDLVDVSKIYAGKLELQKTRFRLDTLIQETAEIIEATSSIHTFHYEDLPSIEIEADRDRISQVLMNIYTNAVRYSPKGGRIQTQMHKHNKHIEVIISDPGIGISPQHIGQIFDRFYQINESYGKAYPGLGMGLHISREILKRHDGVIKVESALGKGSSFSLILPLHT